MIVAILIIALIVIVIYAVRDIKRTAGNTRNYSSPAENDIQKDDDKGLEKYKDLSVEEIVFNDEIDDDDKRILLEELHGLKEYEAEELIETADRQKKNAKLKKFKRQISQKARELYSDIPVNDRRIELSDEVKSFVWTRDGGMCCKCKSRELLEFDHIIPFSKGGSNTARNIELLCEKCNREKSAKI